MANAFALESLIGLFRDAGALAESRSQAVRHLIDSLLKSRPTGPLMHQRRALRMLAVAMEAMATNELTDVVARDVLMRATRVSSDEADPLLTDL